MFSKKQHSSVQLLASLGQKVKFNKKNEKARIMSLSKTANTGTLHDLCGKGAINDISRYLKESLVSSNQLEERVGILGYTPLHEATHRGHVAIVRLLLLHGANPNAIANGFYTCLHLAASMDNADCVKELIKYKADISCVDGFGKTPYQTAVINRCKKTAKILKSAEILKLAQENSPQLKETLRSIKHDSITSSCLQEALQKATEKGHVDSIQSIILAGVKESLKFDECIIMALRFNHIQVLAVLLVCYGAQMGHTEMLQYLLGGHQTQNQKDQALEQLPHSKKCHAHIISIRKCLNEREVIHVAVPLQLSLHNDHKEATKVILLNTNCFREKREIEWRKLALREIDPSILKRIRWVEKLQLSHNHLTSIPSNIIDLHKLCRLYLQNNQLHKIPSGLLRMNCLRELNLSNNKLTELPRKSHWSPSLKTLNVNDNLLEDLPKNIAGSKLKNLYIARNSLYEVPIGVCDLLTLETLDLSGNSRLTQLPVQMGKLTNISTLKLNNLDQVTDPPDHIKANGVRTIMYLRAKLRNAKGYYSMKLMLVGRGAQGKTTLMHRLMNDYTYNLNSATNGISMEEFRIRKDLFHKEYLFRMWDFGGQEDYYATHQCFLSTLSLYILVWNLEEGEDGVAKLEGWLDTISSRAPRTSVIIVGTHLDKIRKDEKYDDDYLTRMKDKVQNLKDQIKYERIKVVEIRHVSCAIDSREGIDELRIAIYDAAFSMLKKVNGSDEVSIMGELIPHSYLLIEEMIKNRKEEYSKAKILPFMHRAEYESLVLDTIRHDASDVEDPNDVIDVTKFLHERGIIMHYDDPNQDLQDYYFIDPSWLCDLMARIVTLRQANPFSINGILFKDKFNFIFKSDRFPLDYYPQFVRLLNRFQIACSLDENRLLVPSKLPEEKPEAVTDITLPYITIKRVHSLPFMPYGFWERFMARLLYYTEEMLETGCCNERSPNSPGGPEIDVLSPFLLDPLCCKCPLESSSGATCFSDPYEPTGSIAEQVEETVEATVNLISEESVPSDDMQGPCSEEDVKDGEEEDHDSEFAGVYQFNDEVEEYSGRIRINGQWFDQERSSSDSDIGYSTDEEGDSAASYGLQQGSYIPRFVRQQQTLHGRKSRNRRRKKKDKSFNFSPESFESSPTKHGSHNSTDAASIASSSSPSLTSSLNRESNKRQDSVEKSNSLTNKTAPGSYDGGESSLASSNSNKEASPSFDKSGEESLLIESGKTINTDPTSPHDNQKETKQPKVVPQSSSPFQLLDQKPLKESVVLEEIQQHASVPSSGNENEHGTDTKAMIDQALEQDEKGPTCQLLPTIDSYLKLNNQDLESYQKEQQQQQQQRSESSNATFKDAVLSNETSETHSSDSQVQDSQQSKPDEEELNVSLENNQAKQTVEVSEDQTLSDKGKIESESATQGNEGERDPESNDSCSSTRGRNSPTSPCRHSGFKWTFQEPVHEAACRASKDYSFVNVPELSTDPSTLIDNGFLFCWRSGICLNHERLHFSVTTMTDPADEYRVLIRTEVSPSRVGRRVLNCIVDHIDTLIREWYPDLSISDGIGPRVKQYVPCVICERLEMKPHIFSFVECQMQSSKSDYIPCPNHNGLDLSLHLVAPDVMLHDVDPDLVLSKDEFHFNEGESSQIGSGGFGKVYRGKCRGQQVAIKFFLQNDETDPLKHYAEARKELNVLRRVRQHPYLISIIGVCLRPLCLVLELAEQGNLQDALFSAMDIHRIVLYRIAYQVADALSYLHSLNIIYRDLKPENILVWSLDERDDLHVKLIDFGTANFATSTGLISTLGTLGLRAPEMLQLSEKKEEYTMQVDVYSYAILLFQMIVRKRPFLEYDSEPMVNDAVVRGERPKWNNCAVASYGLPTMTELMLQCWQSKPTLRPDSKQIAQQVRMPSFQALLGKQPIVSEQSVRHACVVPEVKEIWIGCDDFSVNKILIFDCNNLVKKNEFRIEGNQDQNYSFHIQALHHVAELMLVAVRGPTNFITAYSTSARYNKVWSISLHEQVTCIASDDLYIYVGMNEGFVRCISKKDFKKPEKKRNDRVIKVERHCILSMVALNERLWVSSSKYIFTYFTKDNDVMEAFDMEALWYGGAIGMEDKHQTRITNLTTSFDNKHVWSTCRSILTKWCAPQRQRIFEVDCAPIIRVIDHSTKLHESDSCILCVVQVLDTIWVGTAGGHILIFSTDEPKLLTWFHPYTEVRSLSTCVGPGPCGTEQCLVISTGKTLREDGLGTSDPIVCPLTSERVSDVVLPKQSSYKCFMLVWEAAQANVWSRMEEKSGRVPVVANYQREFCEYSSVDS